MTKSILRFALYLLIGSVLVFGTVYLVQRQVDTPFLSGVYIQLCVLLYFVTLFAYTISCIGIYSKPEIGVYGILGGMMLKMLISLSFFMFFLYTFKAENKVLLGLNFFCIYFLMSGFEVTILLRNLRRKIK